MQLLLNQHNLNMGDQDNFRRTALLFAAQEGHTEVVQLLLSHPEVNVNQLRNPLQAAFLGQHKGVIHLLLEKKYSIIPTDNLKERLLICAAREDDMLTLRLLFEKHGGYSYTDPNSKNADRMTLLFVAASKGHENAVRLLLQHDQMDPNAKNSHKMTPLMYASMSNNVGIVRLLLGHNKVNPNL